MLTCRLDSCSFNLLDRILTSLLRADLALVRRVMTLAVLVGLVNFYTWDTWARQPQRRGPGRANARPDGVAVGRGCVGATSRVARHTGSPAKSVSR